MNPMYLYWGKLYKGTPAELSIEPAVAALGILYRFQHPMFLWGTRFFPDFCFPTIGVVLEIDGDDHEEDDKKAADALRTAALEKLGYAVVRCSNDEALRDPSGTVKRLITPYLTRRGPGLPVSRKGKSNVRSSRRSSNPVRARSKPSKGQGVLR